MEQPNIEYFEKLSNNNVSFKQKLIDIVKYEFPLELSDYESLIKNDKLKEASEIVHKLKHKIGVLGMTNSYVLAETFEHSLRDGGTENQAEFESVLRTVKVFIDQLWLQRWKSV